MLIKTRFFNGCILLNESNIVVKTEVVELDILTFPTVYSRYLSYNFCFSYFEFIIQKYNLYTIKGASLHLTIALTHILFASLKNQF